MNKLSSFELFWLMFMLYDSPYALMLLHYLAQAQGLLAAEMLILAAFLGQAVLYMAVKRCRAKFAGKCETKSLFKNVFLSERGYHYSNFCPKCLRRNF